MITETESVIEIDNNKFESKELVNVLNKKIKTTNHLLGLLIKTVT